MNGRTLELLKQVIMFSSVIAWGTKGNPSKIKYKVLLLF